MIDKRNGLEPMSPADVGAFASTGSPNDPDDHGGVIQPISIPDHAAACGPSDGYDVLLRPRYPFRATPPSVEPRASLDLFVAVSIPRCPASAHQPGPLKLRMCRELAPAELARWSDDYAL